MFKILTDIGIISQYRDTGINTIEEAKSIAQEYAALGYTVEIRDEETDESVTLFNVKED